MRDNFDASLRMVLKHEGGYTNHPSDPGGPTNFGITIADYKRYIDKTGTAQDVRRMTVEQAARIYRERYWNAIDADDLPPGVDYCLFDYGINSGVGRAGRVYARIQKDIGPAPPERIINAICDERLAFLKRLRTWPVFGAGWGRRVKEVRAAAIKMANAAPVLVPSPPDIDPPKDRPKPAVESKTIWSAVAAFVTSVAGALTDWRVATVLVVGLICAYIVYERMRRNDISGIIK